MGARRRARSGRSGRRRHCRSRAGLAQGVRPHPAGSGGSGDEPRRSPAVGGRAGHVGVPSPPAATSGWS
eukprot:6780502-Lingulodinium_polyedra.AAC.1